jgi:hypothetical protein
MSAVAAILATGLVQGPSAAVQAAGGVLEEVLTDAARP